MYHQLKSGEEEFILHTIDRHFDGMEIWKQTVVKGKLLTERDSLSFNEMPELRKSATCLLPGDVVKPLPGNRLEIRGTLYDITIVEPKRDLNGKVVAFRCLCGIM